jgi:hypothetical protein
MSLRFALFHLTRIQEFEFFAGAKTFVENINFESLRRRPLPIAIGIAGRSHDVAQRSQWRAMACGWLPVASLGICKPHMRRSERSEGNGAPRPWSGKKNHRNFFSRWEQCVRDSRFVLLSNLSFNRRCVQCLRRSNSTQVDRRGNFKTSTAHIPSVDR